MPVAKSNSVPRELIPPGTYLAIVNGVFDLGTQDGGQYGPQHKVLISWELHKRSGPVKNKDGKVATISKFYTLSFGDKANLRKDVEGLLNRKFDKEEAKRGYDVGQLLSEPCRLQIVHEKKTDGSMRDTVATVMGLDADEDKPAAETSHLLYDLAPGQPFDSNVPEWIRDMVRKSLEWTEHDDSPAPHASQIPASKGAVDDDIPF